MCNDIVILKYDGRRPGLPSALVAVKNDNSSIEQYPPKYNPSISTYSMVPSTSHVAFSCFLPKSAPYVISSQSRALEEFPQMTCGTTLGNTSNSIFSCIMAYKCVRVRVDISVMVACNASDVEWYDRRTRELYNAPLHMKQDTTSIEK